MFLAVYHFRVRLKQLSHAEDGDSVFLQNVGAFNPAHGTDTQSKTISRRHDLPEVQNFECHHVCVVVLSLCSASPSSKQWLDPADRW